MARRIESLFIEGPAGRLEALLEEPEGAAPVSAALVCHPHPQHGGTMHNKVVYRIARGLRRSGFAVLRFNYRGVNLSEGTYGHGEGELADARSSLQYLRERYPDLPYSLAGFSFGSRIILRLGCSGTRARSGSVVGSETGPARLIAAGFPTIYQDQSYLEGCTVPRVFVQSTRDQYGPLPEFEAFIKTLPEPKKVIVIEAQDHFFTGALEKLEEEIARLAGW